MAPALAGRLLTTEPPGKPHLSLNVKFLGLISSHVSTFCLPYTLVPGNKTGGFAQQYHWNQGLLPPAIDTSSKWAPLPLPGSLEGCVGRHGAWLSWGGGRDTSELALSEFLLGLAFLTLTFSRFYPSMLPSLHKFWGLRRRSWHLHHVHASLCLFLSFFLPFPCPLSIPCPHPFALTYLLSFSSCLLSPAFFF